MAALERVRMGDRAHHKPSEMSGGQQQRVAIARALVTNPAIILADEPTGALDSHTGTEILELFEKLNEQGITLITVTHDIHVGERARRMVQFLDGKVIADDSVSQEDQIE
jgi:putative ABC transport system ATP-binding protein